MNRWMDVTCDAEKQMLYLCDRNVVPSLAQLPEKNVIRSFRK